MLCCVVCYFVVTTSNRIAYMRTRNIDACWVKRKRISDLQLLVVAVLYSNKFLNKPKPSVCVCVFVCVGGCIMCCLPGLHAVLASVALLHICVVHFHTWRY